MIAIIGQSEDDILYFKTKMSIKENVDLYGGVTAYLGSFSKEAAVVVATGQSNYLSSMVTALIIKLYRPYLVFNVGMVCSLSSQLKQGDIFVADRYYFADVDYSAPKLGLYGQIPGEDPFFVANTSLNVRLENAAYLSTLGFIQNGYVLSGEKFIMSKEEIDKIKAEHYLQEEAMVAYDTASAGVALACHKTKTELLTVKAVSYNIGASTQTVTFIRHGLESEPVIGRIVTSFLLSVKADD